MTKDGNTDKNQRAPTGRPAALPSALLILSNKRVGELGEAFGRSAALAVLLRNPVELWLGLFWSWHGGGCEVPCFIYYY